MSVRATPALVVGAGGGIGQALCRRLAGQGEVLAVSRGAGPPAALAGCTGLSWLVCDHSEAAIADLVAGPLAGLAQPLRRVFLCPGLLHGDGLAPEKRLEQFDETALWRSLEVNALIPLRWLRLLWPLLRGERPCVLTAFSARVGSITDNRAGGWYSYRCAKAALNQLLQTAAVELARRAPNLKLLAFHPGATDTALSRPFQRGLPAGYLWTPERVAERLLALTAGLEPDGRLSFLDRDGQPIPY